MKRQHALAIMVVILLLATVLRFYRLDDQSFWNDEGNSARLSERSIDLIVEGAASDIHPPLYYLLLHGWRELVGDTEFGLRSLSAFFGLGVVALSYALGRQLLGPVGWAAVIAGTTLAAVNPALVYYSQETRMYEMLAFLAVLSTLLLVRLLRKPGWLLGTAVAYVVAATAGLYTHYFFPAVLLAQNLVFLSWLYRRYRSSKKPGLAVSDTTIETQTVEKESQLSISLWRDLGAWMAIMLAVFVLYLPWLAIFFRQIGGRSATRLPLFPFLVESGKWMTFGPTIEIDLVILPLLAYTVLLILGLILGLKKNRGGVSFSITLVLSLAIPLAIMWLMGATRPAFFKFMLVAVPPLCLIAGPGVVWVWRHPGASTFLWVRRAIVVILAALVLWGSARSLVNMYFNPNYARADYRAMATQISVEDHPNAAVILNAANQWEVFTYYHTGDAPVFPLPAGYPDPTDIDAELNGIVDRFDRVYALFWGEPERDPQRLVERWLDDHTFKARDEWVGDVRFVTYSVPAEMSAEMATELNLPLGESIILQGYALHSDVVAPGDILQLALFWQTIEQLEQRYKVFLHLVDDQGRIVAQRDSEPGGGLALTTTWSPGETVRDNHGIFVPIETPSGNYTLLLGMYDFANPSDRLSFDLTEGTVDVLPVATITVAGE